jgi:hypothetical protein
MTTTLVTQRRARAGQADALAAAGVRLLATGAAFPARLRIRIFQGLERPDLLLTVSEWTGREAVRPGLEDGPIRTEFDALAVGEPEFGFYHELTGYEPFTLPVTVATCTRIICSRTALSPVLAYMLEVTGPTLRARPGLITHALYQNEDRPAQFLSIRGYASVEAYEAVRRSVSRRLDAGLRERGARLTYFVGRPLADVTRPGSGTEGRGSRSEAPGGEPPP